MEGKKANNHPYKIEVGDTIVVYRTEYNGIMFYKTPITKKNYDGTKDVFYKRLKFKKGTDIPNGSYIIIKNMFEDVGRNKNDEYNPIWFLFIMDYELKEDEEREKEDALEAYNNKSEIEISEDMLPF